MTQLNKFMKAIFQSKLFSNLAVVGIFLFAFFAISYTVQAYTYAGVLQLGSTGSSVVSLQQRLGVSPTNGDFDYTTRGAVVAFQLSVGLVADGIVGPATGRALATAATPSPSPTPSYTPSPSPTPTKPEVTYPAGCTATTLFSATTGKPCKTTTSSSYPDGCKSTTGYSITTGLRCSMPPGCTADSEYSSITGDSCDGTTVTKLVPGCTSREGYSATTGASCLSGKKNSALVGTEGSLEDFIKATGYTNRAVSADRLNTPLAGYVLKGEKYSDISVTYMEVNFKFKSGNASSSLSKYVTAINVTQGSKVGSVKVEDFSKDDGWYSARIPLYGAVVRSDRNTTFNITADTEENISTSNKDNLWTVTVSQVRYMDGTGASRSDSKTGDIGDDSATDFHFVPG